LSLTIIHYIKFLYKIIFYLYDYFLFLDENTVFGEECLYVDEKKNIIENYRYSIKVVSHKAKI